MNPDIVKQLESLLKVQTSNGNWNYDPYMHGMANGMILTLSIVKGEKPEFLKAPKKWLKDNKLSKHPTVQSEGENRRGK